MVKLTKLPNIGKTLAEKLEKTGVTSYDDLVAIGSVEAVLRSGEKNMSTCYNMLYAIEEAIQQVRWHAIPKQERALLKEQFDKSYSAAKISPTNRLPKTARPSVII